MIKQEIIDKIGMYFKLTNFEAEQIYDDVFEYIIQGVKEDNVADINNLGEFIVRYNSGTNEFDSQKSIEFVPASSFEDDIREGSSQLEENIRQQPAHQTEESVNVEDELKRKREDIVNKMYSPPEEYKYNAPEEQKHSSLDTFITPGVISQVHEDVSETQETAENKNRELEDIPQKSFSDFFNEVKEPEKVVHENVNITERAGNVNVPEDIKKPEIPPIPPIVPVESVIPPSAIELHNEITGTQNTAYQNAPELPVSQNVNGDTENKVADTSYYIWYKDSEPNVADTQTMSYEYELLYQATKEAEYKSKLRIYVTTFILFFSIVLLLLIFSPVIYKYFFTPKELPASEEVQEEAIDTPPTENSSQDNTNQNNNQTNTTGENTTQPPPVTNTEQTTQQTQTQQQTQENTNTQQNNTQNIEGITKNAIGWADAKNKVVYVQLENGKFTIQESSWDTDAKANKRLGVIAKVIPGLTGKVTVSDLGAKGKWYRAMVGEFATIQEAKAKADELRSKEK